jgi:hypothetical protein
MRFVYIFFLVLVVVALVAFCRDPFASVGWLNGGPCARIAEGTFVWEDTLPCATLRLGAALWTVVSGA